MHELCDKQMSEEIEVYPKEKNGAIGWRFVTIGFYEFDFEYLKNFAEIHNETPAAVAQHVVIDFLEKKMAKHIKIEIVGKQ
jgi:hypothetical protein